ncbi:MAG: hypothetical protein QME58_06915 [Bacteroidota bacterium]|nr:hypothetical protein [Bacteroidota bacterium]
MESFYKDTSLEAKRIQFQILRRIGIAKRAEMTFELSDNLRAITEYGIRSRHPEYDDSKIRLELVRLILGEKLFNEINKTKSNEEK